MKYLIDTSALVRVLRRQVTPEWHDLVSRGLVAVCEPVLIECLAIANAKSYEQVEDDLRAAYPWVPVPDDAWESVRVLRQQLAARSAHQGLSVADHLVVATALHHRLTVLHEDADFETVARMVPQLAQVRVSHPPG
ncbi:PIN domain-containing protein [Jiangella rhizosphaerae]|uniref:Ribonuclease VapC n=1 Tax=Jiangella rhizosphaerae TaxID=2293569 RepID=A0A418KR65_9ACTN|nr:PIN domain-containing protein [Jiangella rhizosphaerae]RIQ24282.1 PIN domain-containing protein [Jiangella rhizosphaerae]